MAMIHIFPPAWSGLRFGPEQRARGKNRSNKINCRILLIPLFIFFFLPMSQASAGPETKNVCIECHELTGSDMGKPVVEWYGSTHQIQGIACDQCHGGNPDLAIGDLKSLSREEIRLWSKRAMYSAPNFVGAPTGQAQFELCAKCHPESTSNFAASIMGQAYLLKTGGPSCTRCHGAHRNVIPPVPGSCKGCHRDTTGFEKLRVMTISEVQVRELARLRIQVAGQKVAGQRYPFRRHLESFQIALIIWGLVLFLFLAAAGLYRIVERRNK
jgi:hypothetical protein